MGDQDDFDVFNLLKGNGLILATYMVNILKDLGYNDLRTLAQVEGAELIQYVMIESFGLNQEYLDLTDEQKKTLLGPKCWKNPSNFKFQAGEKADISSLKPLCLELLTKIPLVFPIPNTKSQQTSLKVSMRTAGPIPLHTASLKTAKNETVDVTKKGIEAHFNGWCSKRGNLISATTDTSLLLELMAIGKQLPFFNTYPQSTVLKTQRRPQKGRGTVLQIKSVCLKRDLFYSFMDPMVTIHQPLSSDESDQENDPHISQDESNANDKNKNYGGSSNDESTEESRKLTTQKMKNWPRRKRQARKRILIRIKKSQTAVP
ncbi:Uncharacterized protein APZ42_025386 [Daphnia magna]|uniref:Uncharacterized protein n=1 Tax=Daphnia magna TaxID=35525 RepID=A0A162DDA9_9CRUS|nr:Uncharacterized protein APZ42_025386 [Daphnia magna]